VQSKNKAKQKRDEAEHADRIADMPCAVCDEPGPSEVHEPVQGLWYSAVPLCYRCHRDPEHGWHGRRMAWRNRNMDMIKALAVTVRRLMGA
jgi:hypothetical protein